MLPVVHECESVVVAAVVERGLHHGEADLRPVQRHHLPAALQPGRVEHTGVVRGHDFCETATLNELPKPVNALGRQILQSLTNRTAGSR